MDIALIVLDTARGDITNSLIAEEKLTNIATLAQQGRWYTDARANGPWTVPSHGSIFTGNYPSESGINGASPSYESVPLIEELSSQGFKTAGFSANPWLSPEFGFADSFNNFCTKFDIYGEGASMASLLRDDGSPQERLTKLFDELNQHSLMNSVSNIIFWAYQNQFRKDTGGKHLLSQAQKWVSNTKGDTFSFINLTEPHLPYSFPQKWLPNLVNHKQLKNIPQNTAEYNAAEVSISQEEFRILRNAYKGALKYVDHIIGEFIESTSDDTVFIILGDHGEHFGEYDRFGHQYSLYRELLHVPLVISGPGIETTQIQKPVELRSLYNFILSLSNGSINELKTSNYPIAETVSPQPSIETLKEKTEESPHQFTLQYAEGARCIAGEEGKVVEFPDGSSEVIEVGSDTVSVSDFQNRLLSRLNDECGAMKWAPSNEIDVSEATKSQLEDLGYA